MMVTLNLKQKGDLLHSMYESRDLRSTLTTQIIARDYLEELILNEYDEIQIKPSTSDNRKYPLGKCYSNAANNMGKGYEYVEGYAASKSKGFPIQHAWNIDVTGRHLDFTFSDHSDDYVYKGVVIPDSLVYKVGYRNGCVWGPVLPFLTDDELQEVREYNTVLINVNK